MRYLLLILPLFSFLMSDSNPVLEVFIVKQNGSLLEKRYVHNNNTTNVVTYDLETKEPKDSVTLEYDEEGNLLSSKTYNFFEGKYEVDELLDARDYYLQAYSKDSSCNKVLPIKYHFLMEEVTSNICDILKSVLPKGGEVSSLAKIKQNKEVKEISYPDIYTKFNNPYNIFRLYFYNETLISFTLEIENGYLIQESYSFSNGTFIRDFRYDEKGKLKKSIANIKYKNGIGKKITKTYEIE